MNEINTVINDYIREERAKGCADSAIRAALGKSGWKEEQITDAFVLLAPHDENAAFFGIRLETARNLIRFGLVSLVAGIVLLFGDEPKDNFAPMPSFLFLVASALFVPSVVTLAFAFFSASRNIFYRIWVGILALCMAAFVPVTVYYFGVSLLSVVGIEFLDPFFDHSEFLLVNFLMLLPLQVAVYLLAMVTALIHRYVVKRRGGAIPPALVWQGFAMMFIAALFGVGGLYIVLANVHW